MNEDRVTSLWYDTSLEWGVTVAEADDENVGNTVVASSFDEDVEF